jgi:hypothetical protein
VIKASGLPLCVLPLAAGPRTKFHLIKPGFPTHPLPDRYWIDYYANAYLWNIRLDGLLRQAADFGVPAGIAEFGRGANGSAPLHIWAEYCSYLVGLMPRLRLGCLYWGSKVHPGQGQNVVRGPDDPKVPGIRRVMRAVLAALARCDLLPE